MKYFIIAIIFLASCNTVRIPSDTASTEIIQFRKELNELYKNPEKTPLRNLAAEVFEEHQFFPIDLKYRVNADFERITNAEPFEMPTSSGKTKTYQVYGKATFEIDGIQHSLLIYQSQSLREIAEYKDHLFLPFRDLTNDAETYIGGRYIDLTIPKGDKIIIDFNQAYNPYCAYNYRDYSCPIVPEENTLKTRILAGTKFYEIVEEKIPW